MYAVRFGERIGELRTGEISVFITPRALITVRKSDLDIRRRGFELPKSLVQLRRVVLPMREVVTRLLRNDGEAPLAAGAREP
jgi:Mg2+ and Co2+ transporter CorA